MNKLAAVGIIGALLVVVGVWYVNQDNQDLAADPVITEEGLVNVSDETEDTLDETFEGELKEFTVTGSHMAFDPEEIRVSVGDTVRIVFKSEDMPHDWVLDEFNAATDILQAGEEQTIEFVASEVGEFEYYCSVGSHRALGMVGTLIVE